MICRKCHSITPSRLSGCTTCGAADEALDQHYEGGEIDEEVLKHALKLSGLVIPIDYSDTLGFVCAPVDTPDEGGFYFRLVSPDSIEDDAIYGDFVVFNFGLALGPSAPSKPGEILRILSKVNSENPFLKCASTNDFTNVDLYSVFHVPSMFSYRDLLYFIESCIAGVAMAQEVMEPLF